MTPTQWAEWKTKADEKAEPVALRCRICQETHWSDTAHTCALPPVRRAIEAQKRKAEVSFSGPELEAVINHLTSLCGRHLGIPFEVTEVKGKFHYEVGYVWSFKVGYQWSKFAIFAMR